MITKEILKKIKNKEVIKADIISVADMHEITEYLQEHNISFDYNYDLEHQEKDIVEFFLNNINNNIFYLDEGDFINWFLDDCDNGYGQLSYELSSSKSKSGNPETLDIYEVSNCKIVIY